MYQFQQDSSYETPYYSSESSISMTSSIDSCVSFSRLSFENLNLTRSQSSPDNSNSSQKPHRSSDSSWQAIQTAAYKRKAALGLRDFRLVKRIGSGDIGTVYLCRLGSGSEGGGVYAMKVVDIAVDIRQQVVERETMR